jgi:hypothetical protein
MSPVCFRPAFDGIGEVWFAGTVVKKRSVMDDGGTGGFPGTSSIFNSRPKFQRSGMTPILPFELEFCQSEPRKGKNYGKENQF